MFFKEENVVQLGVKELAWTYNNKGLFDGIKLVLLVIQRLPVTTDTTEQHHWLYDVQQ